MSIFSSNVVITASKPDSIFRSLLIVPEGSKEWDFMWKKLSKIRINRGLENPVEANNYGETWQYMASVKCFLGYKHEFRHRLHPKTQRPENIRVRSTLFLQILGH